MLDGAARQATVNRLNRVAGQVTGIGRMVAEDRYCIDILHQIRAVRSALASAESEILKGHADSCVAEAIASGDADQASVKFNELVDLFDRARR